MSATNHPVRRCLQRLATLAGAALSPAQGQSWRYRFSDPQDGAFDASEHLLQHRGALPVPIVITEPAVGAGG